MQSNKTPGPERRHALTVPCGMQHLSRSSSNGPLVLDSPPPPNNSLSVLDVYHRASTGVSDDGFGMGLSSEPAPLSALFRPVREK